MLRKLYGVCRAQIDVRIHILNFFDMSSHPLAYIFKKMRMVYGGQTV